MKRFIAISACLFAVVLSIYAQESAQNLAPPATAEKGSISNPSGGEKADMNKRGDSDKLPTCEGCFNTYSIVQPKTNAEDPNGKGSPCDTLYKAYLLATIIGVVGALIGLGLIWKQGRTIEGQLTEMRTASQQANWTCPHF
jgi:hypothetical protein